MLKKSSKAILLSVGLTVGVAAAASPVLGTTYYSQSQSDYKLFINQNLQLNAEVKIVKNITYVPLQNLMDAIGAEIAWVEESHSAIIVKDSTKVQVIANNENPNNRVKIGDEWVTLEGAPFVENDQVYVPLSFVNEVGFSIYQNQKFIRITASEEKYDEIAQVGNWGRWGKNDERGALNLITPEKVKEATALIKEGKTLNLGRQVDGSVGGYPGRPPFKLTVSGSTMPSESAMTSYDEHIEGTLQWATQLDGLGHVGVGPYFYNGFDSREYVPEVDETSEVVWGGIQKLGIENVGQIFTRGVLLDIASVRGVDMMEEGDEITVRDIQKAMEAQDVEIRPGDAVILHTGWGSLWDTDNERFNTVEPGIGAEAATWLAKQDVSLVGSDTWALEVLPNHSDPNSPFHIHQLLITEHGINILENLVTEELAAEGVYEFAFVLTPLEIQGATASNISPAAYY